MRRRVAEGGAQQDTWANTMPTQCAQEAFDSNKHVSQLKHGKQDLHEANCIKANMPLAKHSSPTSMHPGCTTNPRQAVLALWKCAAGITSAGDVDELC